VEQVSETAGRNSASRTSRDLDLIREGRALHAAAGIGDYCAGAAPLKGLQCPAGDAPCVTGVGGLNWKRSSRRWPSAFRREIKDKEPDLGGQNRPSTEEDCLDWRALERRRHFPQGNEKAPAVLRAGRAGRKKLQGGRL